MNDDDAERHLYCPQCEYDLTGLTESRCPECGAVFDRDHLRAELASAKPMEGVGRSLIVLTARASVLGVGLLTLELLEGPAVLGIAGMVVLAWFTFHHALHLTRLVTRASAAQRGEPRSDLSEFLVVLFGLLVADIFLGIIGVGAGMLTFGLLLYLIGRLLLVR